jgi:uncharacterized protein
MRRFIIIAIISLVIAIAAAGEVLTQSAHSTIGSPPGDLSAQSVLLPTHDKETVSGWFVRGMSASGAVLLVHGIRTDRRQMLSRARFLNKQGYSVLLIDLPAHGESTGSRMTFGIREAEAVKSSLAYLTQESPNDKIGIIGISLGAASTVLALSKASPAPAAIILESMFPTIDEAVSDRFEMRLGAWSRPLAQLLLLQLPIRLGFWAEELRPIAELSKLHVPVLIASGSKDRHTTADETKRIFQAAKPPKELWIVDGAVHQDLYKFEPKIYESKVLAFLGKYLRNTMLALPSS